MDPTLQIIVQQLNKMESTFSSSQIKIENGVRAVRAGHAVFENKWHATQTVEGRQNSCQTPGLDS
jgi:hypothetical protein